MASRRWVGSAVGIYRLLLEQQAAASGAGVAAARQLWQAELSLSLRPSSVDSAAQLHTAVSLRAWLPAAAQASAGALPAGDLRQRRRGQAPAGGEAAQLQAARPFSLHHEEPVRSALTQRPPLSELYPWDSSHVPHQHAPHDHHARPATAAAKYEEVDRGAPAGPAVAARCGCPLWLPAVVACCGCVGWCGAAPAHGDALGCCACSGSTWLAAAGCPGKLLRWILLLCPFL